MCQMSMKLPAMIDQNPPHTLKNSQQQKTLSKNNQIMAKHIPMKNDLKPWT